MIASLYAMASTRLNQIRAHRGSGTTGLVHCWWPSSSSCWCSCSPGRSANPFRFSCVPVRVRNACVLVLRDRDERQETLVQVQQSFDL
jgi:hypothetical protein